MRRWPCAWLVPVLVPLWLAGCGDAVAPAEPAASAAVDGDGGRLAVTAVLGGDQAAGWARARGQRAFRWPEDHGPHPDYRSEWWYFTASLDDAQGRPWGVQFTIFRQALAPADRPVTAPASAWRTRQLWLAHVAVTSPDGHQHAERLSRGALGLAGASLRPFRVHVDGWSLVSASGGDSLFPLHLEVPGADGVPGIRLQVDPGKPLVLQGEAGLSRKGRSPGNASWYYSFTRLPVQGSLQLPGGAPVAVRGSGWLDREWGTSALEDGLVGWDWFALQLDDGRDLMLYQLRRADGSADPLSAGVLVAADGTPTRLPANAFELTPQRNWTDRSGAAWPVAWRVRVPAADLDLQVAAVRDDQLMETGIRYWEGRVRVKATGAAGTGAANGGTGYLEMTGR